jgi:hypothetical protein
MTRAIGWMFVVSLCLPAAASAGEWEQLAFLPWGDGPGEVGLTEAREDELQRGPHGIAVDSDGQVAVVDRVNGRALVLTDRGVIAQVIPLAGKPGPAALLPGGTLAVADEQDDRLVRITGSDERLRSPRWAMPPNRLVRHTDGEGGTVVAGLDAFQLRQPLTSTAVEPHEMPRGVPVDGGGVYVVRREPELWVEFPEGRMVADRSVWPGAPGYGPGAVAVLAAGPTSAVLYLESVYGGEGPIRVERAVRAVGLRGDLLEPVPVAPMGSVVIPADLVALADGRVYQLVADRDGCRLLRARVDVPGVDR